MKATRWIIRNREALSPAGGWIHIVPKGELPNREAGVVQVLDEAVPDAILANIEKDKTRLGNRWPGLYAGEEHFLYIDSNSSPAFAWFKEFEKRGDGIWASDKGLTDLGREAIRNDHFKFTSFVADPKDTENLGGNRVRILGIETVGFTNQANGRDLLTPIRNRDGTSVSSAPKVANGGISPALAARIIGDLADKEVRASGTSLSQSYRRVENREHQLASLALGKLLPGEDPECRKDAAEFASRTLLEYAGKSRLPGFTANLRVIKNRFPVLEKMARARAGFDALSDLEPAAQAAYMAGPKAQTKLQIDEVRASLRKKFPDLQPNGIWAKIEEELPQLAAQWKTEAAMTDSDFAEAMGSLTLSFPDLGREALWAKMKELFPSVFWPFVFSVATAASEN